MRPKLIALLLILFISVSFVRAQISDKVKVSDIFQGDRSLQNQNDKNPGSDDCTIGYISGLNVQIPIAPMFLFQTSLLFNIKNAKTPYGSLTKKYLFSYFEIPLNVIYKSMLGNGYIMVGFGPYIGYCNRGKVVAKGETSKTDPDIEFKNSVLLGNPLTKNNFKTDDTGNNTFAGYEKVRGAFYQFKTQIVMLHLNQEDRRIANDLSFIRNAGFGLVTGHRF
jgi:hypothetical protein